MQALVPGSKTDFNAINDNLTFYSFIRSKIMHKNIFSLKSGEKSWPAKQYILV